MQTINETENHYNDCDHDLGYINIIQKQIKCYDKWFDKTDKQYNKYLANKSEINEINTYIDDISTKQYVPNRNRNEKTIKNNDIKDSINANTSTQTVKPHTNGNVNHHKLSSLNNNSTKQNDNESDTMSKQIKDIHQFYERIDKRDGKRIFRCKWNDCKFTTNVSRNDILRHIYVKHVELKCWEPKCGKIFKDRKNFLVHRKTHTTANNTHNSAINKKLSFEAQRQKRYHEINAKNNPRRHQIGNNRASNKDLSNSIYSGVFNAKDVAQYRERYEVNGKYLYRCKWNGCDYETYANNNIVRHIHVKHIGTKELRCSVPDCDKTFKYPHTLGRHLRYHLCGFQLDMQKYKYGKGLCSLYNIKKYYKKGQMNDANQKRIKYSYVCQWRYCQFTSVASSSQSIENHIHTHHICPNREKTITELISSDIFSK